jgi:hypothetical protein
VQPDSTTGAESKSIDPTYELGLACPICMATGTQRLLRARQVVGLSLPGRPFFRAFAWADDIDRLKYSPLYYGICHCPRCHFSGPESDFRAEVGQRHVNIRTVQRLFVEERAGAKGIIAEILGPSFDRLAEPERSLRLILAAIRTECLPYPELWRRREIARLYLHLAWLYLDECHYDWAGVRPAEAPRYLEDGPQRARLDETLRFLALLRPEWPEIPLDESFTRAEALRYHQEVYQSRSQPEPEEAVLEERQLGELFGLAGQNEQARTMLARAQRSCQRFFKSETLRQQELFEDTTFSMAERRALSAKIQRLRALSGELAEQAQMLAPDRKPAAPQGSPRSSSPPQKAPKKRFGIF